MIGMIDSEQKQTRSNKIFQTIKDFDHYFHEEFEKCGIKKCGHCTAGFRDLSLQFHCSDCGGMGYVGFKRLHGEYVCRTCNGYGCSLCDNRGTVDWVRHARSGDILPEPKQRSYK